MAASMMISTAAVTSTPAINRAAPAQANASVAPFTGLKPSSAFPVTRKLANDFSALPTNGGRVQCMKVWPPYNMHKYETLSYLPDLSREALAREVAYLMNKGWIPCLEFDVQGTVNRKYHASPGYYDGRYWTMWKLPMYGCTDPLQVLKEVDECKKAYPHTYIRIIGFDNVRQVQCISFIAYKPPGYETQSFSSSKTPLSIHHFHRFKAPWY